MSHTPFISSARNCTERVVGMRRSFRGPTIVVDLLLKRTSQKNDGLEPVETVEPRSPTVPESGSFIYTVSCPDSCHLSTTHSEPISGYILNPTKKSPQRRFFPIIASAAAAAAAAAVHSLQSICIPSQSKILRAHMYTSYHKKFVV